MSKPDQGQLPQKVAPRKKFESVKIIKHSDKVLAEGGPNGMRRQWFSMDPKHPQYIGNYAEPHMYGNPEVGYVKIPGWKVCDNSKVKQELPREDQGARIDSVERRGSMVLAEISDEAFEGYEAIAVLKDQARAERLRNGVNNVDVPGYQSGTRSTVSMGNDGSDFGAAKALLTGG